MILFMGVLVDISCAQNSRNSLQRPIAKNPCARFFGPSDILTPVMDYLSSLTQIEDMTELSWNYRKLLRCHTKQKKLHSSRAAKLLKRTKNKILSSVFTLKTTESIPNTWFNRSNEINCCMSEAQLPIIVTCKV